MGVELSESESKVVFVGESPGHATGCGVAAEGLTPATGFGANAADFEGSVITGFGSADTAVEAETTGIGIEDGEAVMRR
jgi:hypothetical protein